MTIMMEVFKYFLVMPCMIKVGLVQSLPIRAE